MKILIRTALIALSLATIPPVANAAGDQHTAPTTQGDTTSAWANG